MGNRRKYSFNFSFGFSARTAAVVCMLSIFVSVFCKTPRPCRVRQNFYGSVNQRTGLRLPSFLFSKKSCAPLCYDMSAFFCKYCRFFIFYAKKRARINIKSCAYFMWREAKFCNNFIFFLNYLLTRERKYDMIFSEINARQ